MRSRSQRKPRKNNPFRKFSLKKPDNILGFSVLTRDYDGKKRRELV